MTKECAVTSADVEQALAADRNQRVSHRQLARDAVVSRPLKRGVRRLRFYNRNKMTYELYPL